MHGKIQYGCANFTDEPVVIGKGTALGKFTCLSRHHELYKIPTECDISGGLRNVPLQPCPSYMYMTLNLKSQFFLD